MKRLITALAAFALLALPFARPAHAAFPWGSSDPNEVSGATPTCTYSATSFFCIENMTANVTSVTLAGMTAGTYYAIAFVQDGTGSRTLAQTSITQATSGPAVPAIPSAANKWTVWYILATSASAATFVQNYDNVPLWDTFIAQQTGDGSPVANTASETPTAALVVPGMTANNRCSAEYANPDANIKKGVFIRCIPSTNSIQAVETNPTAATITPTAATINVRIAP